MVSPKIAITGHSGFLGKHLLDRLSKETKPDIYLYNHGGRIESITEFQPDFIYHLAGEIYENDEMVESNILLTHRLLEESRKLPNLKAMIYIGSSSEYGRKDHAMSEVDHLDPTNMYEATKGAGTLLCQAYARQYGVPVMIARPFSLYGLHESRHRFIPTIIRSILKKKKLKISPGVHDFIHIDDFIDGVFLLVRSGLPGEIYNFGTGTQTSNGELVKIIEHIFDKKVSKTVVSSLHGYDSNCWVSDSTKANLLGWKPRMSLKVGLRKTVNQIIKESKDHAWNNLYRKKGKRVTS